MEFSRTKRHGGSVFSNGQADKSPKISRRQKFMTYYTPSQKEMQTNFSCEIADRTGVGLCVDGDLASNGVVWNVDAEDAVFSNRL